MSPDTFDIDALMRQIRGDVAARWPGGEEPSANAEIVAPAPSVPLARLGAFAEDLPKKSRYSAADFLAYHDEDFLRQVYRRILGRDPDREGASRYLERIRSGALSRIELLGRIRYSAEGRAAGTRVDGLLLPFALRTARRAPIAGRLLGIVQYLWRLPDLVRNHELLESAVFANRTEFRTKVNGILDDIGQRLHGLDAQVAKLDFMDAEVTRIARRVDEVERAKANHGDVDRNVSELRALAARVDEVDRAKANHGDVDRNVGELRALAAQEELARRALVTRIDDAFSRIDEAFSRIDEAERALAEDLGERAEAAREAAARVAALIEEMARTRRVVDALRNGNQELVQRVARMRDRSRGHDGTERVPGDGSASGSQAAEKEGFYVDFEDRFRGTRDDIKLRVAAYLPIVRACAAGTAEAPVLDLGCGRGEWLELLGEEGLRARGVDLNGLAVAGCRARGLDAVESDALAYLRSLPEGTVGAVSAIHVIEHLSFAQIVELFDESRRVLRQGGVVVFETPNPENLIVGACNFYYDPTHVRPLPPEPFRFILESRGFERVEILRLHPDARAADLSALPAELAAILSQRLFGPQDYALIGYTGERPR